jgi:prepilin-type N-terminal cleavage/methylation domain-containing protein
MNGEYISMKKMEKNGFFLIELMTVVAIIGMLISYGTPKIAQSLDVARTNQCKANRHVIEDAANRYFADKSILNPSIQTLVDTGYIKSYPKCSANGTYVWLNTATMGSSYREVGCSIHYIVGVSTGP